MLMFFRRGLQQIDLNIAFCLRQKTEQEKMKKKNNMDICISLRWSIDNTVINTSNKPSGLTLNIHKVWTVFNWVYLQCWITFDTEVKNALHI